MKSLMMFVLLMMAAPCYGQFSDYSPSGSYERFGSPTARWNTDPPRIYSSDGTYLGELSQNIYRQDSISNQYGLYGGRYSPTSVNNPYSRYGAYSTRPVYVYQGWRWR